MTLTNKEVCGKLQGQAFMAVGAWIAMVNYIILCISIYLYIYIYLFRL